jgi:hypothetical protein
MDNRIKKAKDDLERWIEMQNGMIPSEDIEEFNVDVDQRLWIIEQAEKAELLTNGIKDVRKFIDEKSGSVDYPRRLTMDETFEVFMKLTRLL